MVALDSMITGAAIEPGDAVIGLPSSGLHSNGYTLARQALADIPLDDERLGPPARRGAAGADRDLRQADRRAAATPDAEVRGLAHITSGGLGNLLRLEAEVGYEIDDPAAGAADLRADRRSSAGSRAEEMHDVFNMGCGFCVVVAAADEEAALELLRGHHPEAQRIGRVVAGTRGDPQEAARASFAAPERSTMDAASPVRTPTSGENSEGWRKRRCNGKR